MGSGKIFRQFITDTMRDANKKKDDKSKGQGFYHVPEDRIMERMYGKEIWREMKKRNQ